MHEPIHTDWDPRNIAMRRDPLAAYDHLRERCPVAYSDALGWSLFRHADLMRVLHDPITFSNNVSRHVSIPNSLDPPQHTPYRRMIEPYFSNARMTAFEPTCRHIAAQLIDGLHSTKTCDWMDVFATRFAVRSQCAFLGWPGSMHEMLRHWMRENQAAIFAGDGDRLTHLAREFTQAVRDLINHRTDDHRGEIDVTNQLLHECVEGQSLHERELVSILRNWTAGEVGTISAAVGIVTNYLAQNRSLQQQLREDPKRLAYAIEEILRIDGPLISNRRRTLRPVEFHGRAIATGEILTLIWIAANRDGRVFEKPTVFCWDRDQSRNLLYGSGIHRCPGMPLARLELICAMEELLSRSVSIEPIADQSPRRAAFVVGGFSSVPVKITWRR